MSLSDDVKNLEASLGVARQQRDDARAALAKMTAERDTARDELSLATERHAKERDTTTWADPQKWRGPHGEPREDDTHRWREATVDGEAVLLVAYQTGAWSHSNYWGDPKDTIDAACAAADTYVAGLAAKKVGGVFTVVREGAEGWHARSESFDTGSAGCPYVAKWIVMECGGREADKYDFAGEHWATLFAKGGTITEAEVRAWLAARSAK